MTEIRVDLPFEMFGIDSDNGAEFINHDLLAWSRQHEIQFTRGRPYRKNDNCFVEQKDDLAVRRTVGQYRFDTDAEYERLQDVYRALCPSLNYFYASMKLVERVRIGAHVRKVYDEPKPPYQRLLESDAVSEEVEATLRERAGRLRIMKQKRLVDAAVSKLMRLYEQKQQQSLGL